MKIFLAAAIATLSAVHAQDRIDLRVDWKSGSRYTQSLDMAQVVGVPRHGEASATTSLVLGIVTNGGDGERKLAVTYDALKVDIDMPLPKPDEKFDSAKPTEGNRDLAGVYSAMKSSATSIEVDSRGKATAVKGLESFNGGTSVLSRFFGKEQMRFILLQGWLQALPAKPVATGDSWPFKTTFPTPLGNVIINGAYTLGGSEKWEETSCHAIVISGEVEANFAKAATDDNEELRSLQAMVVAMGVKVKEGRMTGKILFDANTRQICKTEVETAVRLSVAAYPENGKPTEIPIKTRLTSTLKTADATKR